MNNFDKINWNLLFLATGIFLTGIGAKWSLIESYALDIATRDAWGAIAKQTLLPWANGTINYWENFWIPWVSHQTGLGRLWAIFLTKICGHWDNQFICTFNALIPCVTSLIILFTFKKLLNNIGIILIPVILCSTLSTNANFENTIESFQFVFYSGITLSLISIFLINTGKYLTATFGFITLFLCITCMAFTPTIACSLILTILICYRKQKDCKLFNFYKLSILLLALIISLIFISNSRKVNYGSLDIFDILKTFIQILSFPFNFQSTLLNLFATLFILSPTFIFIFHIFSNKNILIKYEGKTILTLLIFSLSTISIVSILRSSLEVPSRYSDLSNLLLITNSLVLAFLAFEIVDKHKVKLHFLSFIWIALVMLGYSTNKYDVQYFEFKKSQWDNKIIQNTKWFIDTKGNSFDKNQKLPITWEPHLNEVLFDEKFSKFLPPSIRSTVPIFINASGNKKSDQFPSEEVKDYQRKFELLNYKNNLNKSNSRSVRNNKRYSFLRFSFQGNTDLQDGDLFLLSETNASYPIKLSSAERNRWKTSNFYLPEEIENFQIISNIKQPGQWLALKEPVEVSLESWIARKVRKAGIQIHIIGIIMLIFALSWRCRFIWIRYDT